MCDAARAAGWDKTEVAVTPPPTPADLWNALGDLSYATKWEGPESEAVKEAAKAADDLLWPARDWAIPCQPTAFDAGDGWEVAKGSVGWFVCRSNGVFTIRNGSLVDPCQLPDIFPTPRAAWEALQQYRVGSGQTDA